jgi:hypothetical protein
MCRRSTNAYAHLLDFQYNFFGKIFSIAKKQPSLVNFNLPHCGKYLFSQCSTALVDVRFCRHISNSPRDKHNMMHHPCLLEKVVFLASKALLSPIGTWKKTFSSTLNFMISQMVRNECVRFGRHIDRQINYKILRLKVPNNFALSTLLLIGAVLRQF